MKDGPVVSVAKMRQAFYDAYLSPKAQALFYRACLLDDIAWLQAHHPEQSELLDEYRAKVAALELEQLGRES